MSDELIISGGGSHAIATDEMLSSATGLVRAAEMTRSIVGAIDMVDARLTTRQLESLGIPSAAAFAEADLDCARTTLDLLAQRAELMSGLVRIAAETYGWGENIAQNLIRRAAADAAAAFGFLFPAWAGLVLLTTPLLPFLTGAGIAAFLLSKTNPEFAEKEWMSAQLTELISDPAFLRALRHGVMTVDEFTAGAGGVPPAVVSALSAAGLIGLGTSAGFIQKAGGIVGVLKETPVVLKSTTQPEPVEAAQTFEERVARIPQPTSEHPEQIRIEKFETPGEPDRFEVYIAGTVEFAISDSDQPLDGTSNLSLAAGQQSGAVSAVAAAMREAGITSESPVTFSGHSQGAATAARLAESGEYNTVGVFTVGGNLGQIDIPDEVRAVVVEHTDDLVVAAGGLQDNSQALVVERQAFGERALPEGVPVPAHQVTEYRETARLMDQSGSDQIRESAEALGEFTRGATTSTVTSYHYERVEP